VLDRLSCSFLSIFFSHPEPELILAILSSSASCARSGPKSADALLVSGATRLSSLARSLILAQSYRHPRLAAPTASSTHKPHTDFHPTRSPPTRTSELPAWGAPNSTPSVSVYSALCTYCSLFTTSTSTSSFPPLSFLTV
jgi:hypothetical protein